MQLVGQRKRLLAYMQKHNLQGYRALIEKLGLRRDDLVRVHQHGGQALLPFLRDDRLPANCARIPAACAETSGLGALFGEIELERVAAQQKVSA